MFQGKMKASTSSLYITYMSVTVEAKVFYKSPGNYRKLTFLHKRLHLVSYETE